MPTLPAQQALLPGHRPQTTPLLPGGTAEHQVGETLGVTSEHLVSWDSPSREGGLLSPPAGRLQVGKGTHVSRTRRPSSHLIVKCHNSDTVLGIEGLNAAGSQPASTGHPGHPLLTAGLERPGGSRDPPPAPSPDRRKFAANAFERRLC